MENLLNEGVGTPVFETTSDHDRRDLAVDEFFLTVSDYLHAGLEHADITQVELAKRIGKTKGHVSQILSANRNLTLRSVAEISYALGLTPTFGLVDSSGEKIIPEHLKRDTWGGAKIIPWGGHVSAPSSCNGEQPLAA